MSVCWLIPGMPLFWRLKRGAIVVPVGRVPKQPEWDLQSSSPTGKHSHVKLLRRDGVREEGGGA